MCRELLNAGNDVLLATTDADGPDALDVQLENPVTYNGVNCVFFRRQFTESFKYSRPFERWLCRNVHDFDAVHIHAVFSHASIAAAAACLKQGVPYIVRPLGTLDPWSVRQKSWKKRILWYGRCRKLMLHAATVHYTTKEKRRVTEESLGLSRGVVIPLGINESHAESGCSLAQLPAQLAKLPIEPYVLVLCRLHPKKN